MGEGDKIKGDNKTCNGGWGDECHASVGGFVPDITLLLTINVSKDEFGCQKVIIRVEEKAAWLGGNKGCLR